MNTENTSQPSQEAIATYAYHLWESNGRQHGHDQEYWFQAQKHLKARTTNQPQLQQSPAQPQGNPQNTSVPTGQKRKSSNGSANKRQPAFA